MNLEINAIAIDIPDGCNIILGQTHFIKTAEDLYEIIATTVSQARFGIAFTEASGPCLIRTEGNDDELIQACVRNLQAIGSGHVFCILLRDAYPINILNQIKNCPEVCGIYCATANPLQVIVASTAQGSGVLGVIDGFPPKGVESDDERQKRRDFLRAIGYKR
ncbi:adenosine monophosphate-protein transferase [Geobacter hydrogenophilus]|uniref:Adenosine kinase n=1 Tax=Geobacter hydrogenophilus TaxID=40983 RepID=A0A9W6LEK0_9BACT|nr:adenosine-specific kinase [Geobacter hydrogenophilus]MBT0892340.1 adenosine monophosphate-protein transferase [Geobacter hydrogenophilus]GLI39734.1 adenosine kinase [Geobacter hydrogenophilus]